MRVTAAFQMALFLLWLYVPAVVIGVLFYFL